MSITQEGRSLKISTPLGADALVLRSVRVQEALSRPYLIQAEMVATSDAYKPTDLIGKVVGVTITDSGLTREFSGVVRNFGKVGQMDFARSLAPDGNFARVVDVAADNFPPVGSARYLVDDEAHIAITSRKTR